MFIVWGQTSLQTWEPVLRTPKPSYVCKRVNYYVHRGARIYKNWQLLFLGIYDKRDYKQQYRHYLYKSKFRFVADSTAAILMSVILFFLPSKLPSEHRTGKYKHY